MRDSRCKHCGRPIVWVKTKSGKSMPCDIDLVFYWERAKAPGKVVTPSGEVISCDFRGEYGKATGVGYISHFATCPAAKNRRKSNVS